MVTSEEQEKLLKELVQEGSKDVLYSISKHTHPFLRAIELMFDV